MTTAAYVAKIIRAELKATFPTTKFSVTSETYTGGNSINIRYAKGSTAPDVEVVQRIVDKFKAGHFDGMTDSYEFTNNTKAPTVMYIFASTYYPAPVREAVDNYLSRSASPEEWRAALDAELTAQGY